MAPTAPSTAKAARSYRCHYHPQDGSGFPMPADTGVLPFVQVQASSAEDALRKAHAVTGCAVATAERMERAETVAA